MVCDDQWNPLVVVNPCLWGESTFSPDVSCSINLVLDKGGVHRYDVGGGISVQMTTS